MSKSDEYRARALECEQEAVLATSEEARRDLEQLVVALRALAEALEQRPSR